MTWCPSKELVEWVTIVVFIDFFWSRTFSFYMNPFNIGKTFGVYF